MKSLILLGLLAAGLLLTGCKTDAGSREFIPDKGWMPMRK
jgi:predicted small secreted protein